MKKKFIVLILTSILFISFSFCQNSCELFFGGNEYERGVSIKETSDGGFIITGETESFAVGLYDIYLLKLDSQGNLVWEDSFGGGSSENGNCVIQTINGGYMVGGYSVQNNNRKYLRKVSADGSLEWEKGFPDGSIKSIIQLVDGSYVFAGDDWSEGNTQMNIAKISSTGNIMWEVLLGGSNSDYGRAIAMAADGGFVVAGESRSNTAGPADMYVVKVSEEGEVIWEKKIGGNNWDFANDVKATNDEGFILAGIRDNPGLERDAYLVKINSEGEIEWEKSYGGLSFELAEGVIQTSDGGFAITGRTQSFGNGASDLYFVKTDENGEIEWEKAFGGTSIEDGFDLIEISSGGYALLGNTWSFGAGSYDVYFIKTDENGEIVSTSNISDKSNIFQVFPNPADKEVFFNIDPKVSLPITLNIVTASGQIIYTNLIEQYEISISNNLLPNGILFYSLKNDKEIFSTGKILIK